MILPHLPINQSTSRRFSQVFRYLKILVLLFPSFSMAQAPTELLLSIHEVSSADTYEIFDNLQDIEKDKFSNKDKEAITLLLNSGTPHYNQLILFAGYLEIEETKPFLRVLADSTTLNSKERWAAYLALARMDEQKGVSFIQKQMEKLPVNDQFIYEIVPDIIFTRNKILYKRLIEILNYDTPFCSSADPDSEVKIACGYRLMESLAPVIREYPLKLTVGGDIDTNDYPKALNEVRLWFASKGDQYQIDRSRF